jgi:hypothetical protein
MLLAGKLWREMNGLFVIATTGADTVKQLSTGTEIKDQLYCQRVIRDDGVPFYLSLSSVTCPA